MPPSSSNSASWLTLVLLAAAGVGCAVATYIFFREEQRAREARGAVPGLSPGESQHPAPEAVATASVVAEAAAAEKKAAEKDRASLNEKLVHQMMVDPNFKLQHKEPSAIERHIRDVMKRAFWDGFKQDLEAGKFERVITMLDEIKERLLGFVPRRADWRQELEEKMDMGLMRQMLVGGAFDAALLTRTVQYIVSKIGQLEAPSRDAATKSWLAEHVPKLSSASTPELIVMLPAVFEFLFSKLDTIELDMANFQLQRLQPVIQKEGFEYQRRKFAAQLASGDISLEKTSKWIRRAAVEEFEAGSDSTTISFLRLDRVLAADPRVVAAECFRFLHFALVRLVAEGASLKLEAPPDAGGSGAGAKPMPAHARLLQQLHKHAREHWAETLALEAPQLLSLQTDFLCVVRVGVQQMRILQVLPQEGLPRAVETPTELQQLHTELMHAFLRPVPPQAQPVGSDGKYTRLVAGSSKPPPLPVIAERVVKLVQAVTSNQGHTLSPGAEASIRSSVEVKMQQGVLEPVYALVCKRFDAALRHHDSGQGKAPAHGQGDDAATMEVCVHVYTPRA
eukprot:g979.t1